MASRYIIAISYSDTHGKRVYQKYHKQRPLGRLAKKHNILLEEPLYSHEAVGYDVGTNWVLHNLHSKSANALLERDSQNKTNSRSVVSMEEQDVKNEKARRKPNSAPPSLQGKNKKPLYKLRIDYDYLTAQHSVSDINKKIHTHHQGKSSCSSVSDSSLSSRHGDTREESWLRFGGSPESKGVINAFTEHDAGEFYIVKGDTGSHVAMKLKKGEKIRIGKNGHTSDSTKANNRSKSENEVYNILMQSEESEKPKKSAVPLCWQDAVNDAGAKVIVPEKDHQEKLYVKSNSSKPIIFEKLNPDGLTDLPIKRNTGYRIVHKNKPGLLGDTLSHGVVKSMSYEHVEDRSVAKEPTCDEIVKNHLDKNKDKKKSNRSRRPQQNSQIPVDLMTNITQRDTKPPPSRMSMVGSVAWTDDSRPASCVHHYHNTLHNKQHENSTASLLSAARPRTASSITSSFVVDTDPSLGIIQPGAKPRSKPERVRSPTKPPSARPLHRSRGGRSHHTGSEQFIKITSQLRVPTPPSQSSNNITSQSMVTGNTAPYSPDTVRHPSAISHLLPSTYEIRQLNNTPITLGSHVLIPTAHSIVGSDVNSMSDFSEHDFNQVDADLPDDFGNDYHHNSLEDLSNGHHVVTNPADYIPDATHNISKDRLDTNDRDISQLHNKGNEDEIQVRHEMSDKQSHNGKGGGQNFNNMFLGQYD